MLSRRALASMVVRSNPRKAEAQRIIPWTSSSSSFKLIKRKQNDLKGLIELDKNLRLLDKIDPVKYDFALFSLGAFENF